MGRALIVFSMFLFTTIWAGEPGEPIDCSDWVFSQPGFICETVGTYPCVNASPHRPGVNCLVSQDNKAVDNTGAILSVREVESEEPCLATPLIRLELTRYDGLAEQLLAQVSSRCVEGQRKDRIEAFKGNVVYGPISNQANVRSANVLFDPIGGALWITTEVLCSGTGCTYPSEGATNGVNPLRVFRIGGFATTFEVLQSYAPAPGTFGFRVPYLPEGLRNADWFDSYYGDLARVGDWTQLRPLRCGYPATAPNVGDYLTIADELPTPSPGQGFYFVTAVNFQGDTRYGRKNTAGVLSGRDPTVLPACTE